MLKSVFGFDPADIKKMAEKVVDDIREKFRQHDETIADLDARLLRLEELFGMEQNNPKSDVFLIPDETNILKKDTE